MKPCGDLLWNLKFEISAAMLRLDIYIVIFVVVKRMGLPKFYCQLDYHVDCPIIPLWIFVTHQDASLLNVHISKYLLMVFRIFSSVSIQEYMVFTYNHHNYCYIRPIFAQFKG